MRTMRARALLGALVALVAATTLASCEQEYVDGRYEQPVFEEVEPIAEAVEYRQAVTWDGQPISLKLDIWAPKDDGAERRPAVVWAFGGGFIFGNRQQLQGYAQDSARRGYVGVTIDYRLDANPGTGGLSGVNFIRGAANGYEDTLAAVQWLQTNAAQYRIDPGAVVVGGYSAGAINAVHTATRPDSTPVAGVVSIAGMTFNEASTVDAGFGSPRPGLPPFIMFGGTNDTTVTYAVQVKTCDDMKAAGNVCDFVSYEGAGHEIGVTQAPDIEAKAAKFISEKILPEHFYKKKPA
jgi:acetyl esterase/lipase